MELEFGSNGTTFYIVLPLLALVAALIVFFIIKTKVSPGQKAILALMGIFCFVGFSVITLCVYYQVNDPFALAFKYYAYSALAPDERNPFAGEDHDQSVLTIRAVNTENDTVSLLEHPNPYAPTLVTMFLEGKYVLTHLHNGIFTLPSDNLDREVSTSLWWAMTTDMYVGIGDADDWEETPMQELGHDFESLVPTGWQLSGSQSDVINTVKFGSPAEHYSFRPAEGAADSEGMYVGPSMSASSFTIDERLSARDVANLIQDSGIADKIEEGTDECLFPTDVSVSGIGYYAYISDNTDLTKCTDLGSGIAKELTLVLKNEGDERTIVVTLVAQDNAEFSDAYWSLREFVNIMNLNNASFQLTKPAE